jgi:hypothetical protein
MYVFTKTIGNNVADVELSNGSYQASISINGNSGHIKDFDNESDAIEYAENLLKNAV